MTYDHVMKVINNLPKRRYCSGDKRMVSWRLPETLIKKLESVAKDNGGWSVTDVVMTALDDYIQYCESKPKSK